MTSETPAAYHHGNLRATAIAAGVRLVDEGGPQAVTVRGIARLSGVSHTAPLHHFRDREALLRAVGERGYEMLGERLQASLAGGATGSRAALRECGTAGLELAVEHPGLFRLMLDAADSPPAAGAYDRIAEACGASIAAGEVDGDDPDRIAVVLWGLVHGLGTLLAAGAGRSAGPGAKPGISAVTARRALDDALGALAAGSASGRRRPGRSAEEAPPREPGAKKHKQKSKKGKAQR